MRKVILVEPVKSKYTDDLIITDSWDKGEGSTVVLNVPTGFTKQRANRPKKKKKHRGGRYSPSC